jgi:murein DD-endopeptidase MepM/ murein hydrolase activator NlpD
MKYKVLRINALRIIFVVLILNTSYLIPHTFSQTADDLQAKIDQRNQDIQNLEKDISSYQKQLNDLGTQAYSLSSTIKSLQLTQKKLEANIAVTQDKISAKSFEIQQLGSQISTKQNNISDDQRIVAQSFKQLDQLGNKDITNIVLGSNSISEALNMLEELSVVQKSIFDRIGTLNSDKNLLQVNKSASEKAKADLVSLNQQLADQRKVVLATASQQSALLKQTNQSETSYKQLLAQKKAQEAEFQAEIDNYEAQLNLNIDISKLPHTGSGVLSWPLSNTYPDQCPPPANSSFVSCITQYFGNTPFATANPQIYNGKGHTGVDFRASIGTPVKAALIGTVIGISNTDLVPGCYSYGQWIMIKHPNGLSTLYAHLSVESVQVGQAVTTGQIIGYSGNTGYTTGPHLHFGVYATDGVQIKKFDNSVNCKGATIPVADFKAYLNPLSYL